MLKSFAETDEEPFRVETPEAPPGTLERYLKPDAVDWSWRIYPSTRTVPFVEMEYTLPLAEGPAAMRAVRDLMQTRHPDCTWAVEYRTQPGEHSLLSPTQGAESVTISLHQAMGASLTNRSSATPRRIFLEPTTAAPTGASCIFWIGMRSPASTRSYPAFRAIRAELDPDGVFTNGYLAMLGVAGR